MNRGPQISIAAIKGFIFRPICPYWDAGSQPIGPFARTTGSERPETERSSPVKKRETQKDGAAFQINPVGSERHVCGSDCAIYKHFGIFITTRGGGVKAVFNTRNFKPPAGSFALTSVTLGIRCQLAYFDISLVSGSNFCSLQ